MGGRPERPAPSSARASAGPPESSPRRDRRGPAAGRAPAEAAYVRVFIPELQTPRRLSFTNSLFFAKPRLRRFFASNLVAVNKREKASPEGLASRFTASV